MMQSTTCPYCNSARSILLGNVFCSRHSSSMEELNTGTLFISTSRLEETDWHVSRLSIRCMLNGEQYYKAGNRECRVTPDNFLVINKGQQYKTSFESDHEQEMLMVGFKPGFAESVLQSLSHSDEWLLDNSTFTSTSSVHFLEQTYPSDPVIRSVFEKLRTMVVEADVAWNKQSDLDSLYTTLITRLITLNSHLHAGIRSQKQRKAATQLEIHKRLAMARDFMDAYYETTITLDDIAKSCALSVHHFKRLFKEYFHVSPHQYIVQRRLQQAEKLLTSTSISVRSVCQKVGFENDASFIRLFREHYHTTPAAFSLGAKKQPLI